MCAIARVARRDTSRGSVLKRAASSNAATTSSPSSAVLRIWSFMGFSFGKKSNRWVYWAGSTKVLPSRLTAVCASNLPLMDAPVCSVTDDWLRTTPSKCAVVPRST